MVSDGKDSLFLVSLPGVKLALRVAAQSAGPDPTIEQLIGQLAQRQERPVRLQLLEELVSMTQILSERLLREQLWPLVQAGASDAQPALRALSLRLLAAMAPRLPVRLLAGEAVRMLSTLLTDEQPGIRVNALVALAKLASLLDPPTVRGKVLLALCRGLHDPFAPARQAALTGLEAGCQQSLYGPSEQARVLLPAILPLTLDPEPAVRQAAFALLEAGISVLREQARQMPAVTVERVPSANERGVASSTKATSPTSPKAASAWSSWALDSLTTRLVNTALGGDDGDIAGGQEGVGREKMSRPAQQEGWGSDDLSFGEEGEGEEEEETKPANASLVAMDLEDDDPWAVRPPSRLVLGARKL